MDIKPSKKTKNPPKTGPTTTEQTTFQKVATSEGTQKRTALFHTIDELKDNSGFAHTMFGFLIQDLDAQALSENFAEIKELFKQYEEFGITIPKDILNNFEFSDGSPVFSGPANITEAQAEELKTLASKGETLLQEKLEQQKITYGPFQAKEIVSNVSQQKVLTSQEVLNFLSISTSFRKLAKERDRLVLTGSDLSKPDLQEKLQFARENNLRLNFKLNNDDEFNAMITFMQNPANSDLLKNIEALHLPDITDNNNAQVHKLLNFIPNNCPNLTSLSFEGITVPLTLPQLDNLTSLSFGSIIEPLTLPRLDNLTSLSFGNIWDTLTLSQLDNLTSLSFVDINAPLTLRPLDKLTSLSFGDICAALTLPPLDRLASLAFGGINVPLTLPQLDQLTSLSVQHIPIPLTLPLNMNNLISFSYWDISINQIVTIKNLPNEVLCHKIKYLLRSGPNK